MDAVNSFRKLADECDEMAKRASDREGRYAWHELAQQWRARAEVRQSQVSEPAPQG